MTSTMDYLITLRADKSSAKTKALAVPSTKTVFEVTEKEATTRYSEYATQGTTKQDQQVADVYYRLSQGAVLISLAESIAASVLMDRNGNQMVRLVVCRADASEVIGIRHPDGTWELAPNRGPKFTFSGVYEPSAKFRSKRLKVVPPPLLPQYRVDKEKKYLFWSGDWRLTSPPPGQVYVATQVTPNLYEMVDTYEFTQLDSLVTGGFRK